jgi:hypothetical protein
MIILITSCRSNNDKVHIYFPLNEVSNGICIQHVKLFKIWDIYKVGLSLTRLRELTTNNKRDHLDLIFERFETHFQQ